MRICIRRSGGFAGIEEDLGAIDTAALPVARAAELERLVGGLGKLRLGGEAHGADLLEYRIRMQDEGEEREITIKDDGSETRFMVIARVDTPDDVEYYRHGGLLPFVLRGLVGAA